jgi:pimeloyl-ACP methyl ester carboxylesterase
MAKAKRLVKSFYRLLFPVVLLVIAAFGAASVWLVYETSKPRAGTYLVTPEKYGLLSSRGAQVTEETWTNRDGTPARGWLLRGAPGSPAVILLHKYEDDRSHVLNLGVKLNEATNFTVFMPDQRAHGQNPAVTDTSFGGCEADDTGAAIAFLRGLRSPDQLPMVGGEIGIYGLELGALAALSTASADPSVKALVLDSVPADSDGLLAEAVARRYPFASAVTSKFASLGTYGYYYNGCYKRVTSCEMARTLASRKVMLLAGVDEASFQESTSKLSKCFLPSSTVDVKTDLSPSGFSIINASLELSGAYDQRVIDYFRLTLGEPQVQIQVAAN